MKFFEVSSLLMLTLAVALAQDSAEPEQKENQTEPAVVFYNEGKSSLKSI